MADTANAPLVTLLRRPISEKRLVKAIERRAAPPRIEGWLCHPVSPGEWFMVAEAAEAAPSRGPEAIIPGFDPASGYLTVDASAAWHCMRIAGAAARALTAKGTALDLDPSVFAPGAWRSCRFGHYRVHLHLVSDTQVDLYFERSLAPVVDGLLRELGAEFDVAVEQESDETS